MNFWTALVLIVAIMLVTSLIYNIFKNRHAEKMFMLQLEKIKIEQANKYNEVLDKRIKSKKVEK